MKPSSIVVDKTYPQMWRIVYDDGVVSEEIYNLSRANDILKHYKQYVKEMNQRDSMAKNSLRDRSNIDADAF